MPTEACSFSIVARYFNEFLMAHHRQVAREIKDEYIDTMSKIYFSYFKTYISKLLKLQVSKYHLFLVDFLPIFFLQVRENFSHQ